MFYSNEPNVQFMDECREFGTQQHECTPGYALQAGGAAAPLQPSTISNK